MLLVSPICFPNISQQDFSIIQANLQTAKTYNEALQGINYYFPLIPIVLQLMIDNPENSQVLIEYCSCFTLCSYITWMMYVECTIISKFYLRFSIALFILLFHRILSLLFKFTYKQLTSIYRARRLLISRTFFQVYQTSFYPEEKKRFLFSPFLGGFCRYFYRSRTPRYRMAAKNS